MRRTLIVCAALICTAAASVSIAAALPRSATSTATTDVANPPLVRTVHLTRFYPTGPSMSVGGGAASAYAPPAVTFRLPASASTYTAMITFSLDYRTTGSLHYLVNPDLTRGATTVAVTPLRRNIAPSNVSASTTSMFRTSLRSGVTYALTALASVSPEGLVSGSITTSRFLVDIEAWPTS